MHYYHYQIFWGTFIFIMDNSEKLFNKGFLSITIINFIVYLVYYLLMVIITLIAQNKLHATVSEAGLAAGIYVIGTLVARLYIGKKLEVFGRRSILKWGAIFYLLTTAAYLFMPSILILCIVRFLNGFFYGMVSTATNAIVTSFIPFGKRGEGINYYGLSTSLAAAIGPFIGLMLVNKMPFTTIIWIAILLLILTTAFVFVLKVPNVEISDEEKNRANSWKINTFFEKRVTIVAVIAFFMGLSYSSVLSYLASYSAMLNLVTAGSYFFIVYALVITVTRPLTGKLFDLKGENWVMYPSFVFLSIGLILMAVLNSSWLLLVTGGIIGIGYGTFMSNGQAMAIKLVPESARVGIALSTYFVGLDLGIGVGPYAFGIVRNFVSFRNMYIVASMFSILCIILYTFYYLKNKSNK